MADGPAFYDDDAVFAAYMFRRQRIDNPNDTLEAPIMDELVGEVRGHRVLDLGCGAATFGRDVLDRGVASYVGVEGSRKMAALARSNLAHTTGELVECRIEDFTYAEAAFDLVVSRLVLHYIEHIEPVLSGVRASLVPGGRFIFSVEHPVITSCSRGWAAGTDRQDWIVDDYFASGPRDTRWMGGAVRKYHRTLEDYFTAMQRSGFVVEQLRESRPDPTRFADVETYQRRMRIPLFLIIAGRRS